MSDPEIDWVSASELASYTYCGRSYWLERVVHAEIPGADDTRRQAGLDAHAAHGRRVAIARALHRLALVALAIFVASAVALVFL